MKFFKCPCCNKLHFTRLNGLSFENKFQTLKDFTIKKRLKCSKCHNNLAVLNHNTKGETKIIWEEYYKVYDDAYQKQQALQDEKNQILSLESEFKISFDIDKVAKLLSYKLIKLELKKHGIK